MEAVMELDAIERSGIGMVRKQTLDEFATEMTENTREATPGCGFEVSQSGNELRLACQGCQLACFQGRAADVEFSVQDAARKHVAARQEALEARSMSAYHAAVAAAERPFNPSDFVHFRKMETRSSYPDEDHGIIIF